MEWINFKQIPIEYTIVAIAFFGGVARYLLGYINGGGFKFSIFLASIIVSGFGGLMFGWLGVTMNMPNQMLLVMAGMGGYFSEQTLKLIYELVTKKLK